ncbi:hypothetical protein BC938DRAFT_476992 [Jimgerdemannia flammicorona]|uniref:Uncharacterized protein n=1 Tax=Jimgerdemannia flammicorona TaxID=994334 RepID=A0A433PCR6_9FUNG|nr:hypothetical protein BC938DRAFT_476992 [Jimgerdemannia flammicorona]
MAPQWMYYDPWQDDWQVPSPFPLLVTSHNVRSFSDPSPSSFFPLLSSSSPANRVFFDLTNHNLIESVFMNKGSAVDITDSNFPGLKVRIFPQDFYLHYFGTKVKLSRVPG